MHDPRVKHLAEILVGYSARVKKGDIVLISAVGAHSLPLVKELYVLCLQKGAKYVEYDFSFPELNRHFYNIARKEQLEYFPEHRLDFMKKVDVFFGISSPENSMTLVNARQEAFVSHARVMRPIQECRVNRTRWVVTRFPTVGSAQEAKMSLEEYEEFFFSACCIDWASESRKQEKLKRLMDRTERVRIAASDTELTFSLKGMPGIKCDGRYNIPDGEVFSAPVRDSVNGYITYNCPTIYQGKEFDQIRLVFQDGKIINATSPRRDAELNRILDTDEGARYVGEFAIGVNPAITTPMRNILFDEKIFGSIHFTPGSAYEECDNGNRSAVHWDMVKMLSGDGEIWFDDRLIQKDGLFVHPDLLPLNPH